ncbi:helix-turn-helix domain-containing protein [Streptomyces yunnanensis]|uniref:Sugar-specific transcriptional regulator TrmB n=1 Tax=Streptomyces yunnanensis TaxID=156453 RepID=A0A9X8MU45_9ACTN|nr:helix-turn-helix domain-containing protein [Streptomyces yunnanensis]SHL81429.1 Sugar-specific transcriptional regulator TrmB [Streptomyces yunnanensis]
MSDTTPDSGNTPHADTAPEPLTGLTGAQAAVYTELLALAEPTTVTKLAHAADVGHSTAGKALTTLEKQGLAARIPGGHDGPRRTPDLWHPAPDDGNAPAPANAKPAPSTTDAPELTTADAPESDGDEADDGKAAVDGLAPDPVAPPHRASRARPSQTPLLQTPTMPTTQPQPSSQSLTTPTPHLTPSAQSSPQGRRATQARTSRRRRPITSRPAAKPLHCWRSPNHTRHRQM